MQPIVTDFQSDGGKIFGVFFEPWKPPPSYLNFSDSVENRKWGPLRNFPAGGRKFWKIVRGDPYVQFGRRQEIFGNHKGGPLWGRLPEAAQVGCRRKPAGLNWVTKSQNFLAAFGGSTQAPIILWNVRMYVLDVKTLIMWVIYSYRSCLFL